MRTKTLWDVPCHPLHILFHGILKDVLIGQFHTIFHSVLQSADHGHIKAEDEECCAKGQRDMDQTGSHGYEVFLKIYMR